ncbi:MAG: DUF1353 domain-containing protein [Alphaproteobacteria bacterium]|nr:DUF1353 domain-containing protein [Alphaproteobacteria bacterium]
MPRFTHLPAVTLSTDGKTATIIQGFRYDLGRKNSGKSVYIDQGMCTDGLTLPKLMRFMRPLAPRWAHLKAVLVHDQMCKDGYYIEQDTQIKRAINQKAIDVEFYVALRALGMPKWKAKIYYAGVRFYQVNFSVPTIYIEQD